MTTTAQERDGARFRTWVPAGVGLCIFAALAVVQLVLCRRYPTDYDEGVYLQTLRAIADGFEPYREMFLAQPPVFVDVVMPFFGVFGEDLAAARLAMVAFWAAGIAGIHVVGSLLSSKRVGLLAAVLLALDPLFLTTGRTLQPEMPALTLAVWSVAAGLYAVRQTDNAKRIAAGTGSGVLLTLAIATKFIAVPVLIPLVVIAFRNRPDRRTILAVGLGAAATAALLLGPLLDSLPAFYDQTVRFHREAAALYSSDIGARFDAWVTAMTDPLVNAAVIGFIVAAYRRSNPVLLSWFAASAGLLLVLAPLWPHHFASLAPPAALLTAGLVTDFARWSKPCAAILVCVMSVFTASSIIETFARSDPYPQWAMTELRRITEGERFIVTDDQFLASTLGLRVPPELVDTSLVRIESGHLDLEQVTRAMDLHGAELIVLTSGRLARVPGLPAWVMRSCKPMSGLVVARVFACPNS